MAAGKVLGREASSHIRHFFGKAAGPPDPVSPSESLWSAATSSGLGLSMSFAAKEGNSNALRVS